MDPSAQELPATEPPPAPAPPEPDLRSAEHLSLTDARDLLDWLEGQKIRPKDVVLEADGTMTVRWPA
jgi:hypothetical protein